MAALYALCFYFRMTSRHADCSFNFFYPVCQRSDYVTGVKDRCWASNWIMLEFDRIVHNSGGYFEGIVSDHELRINWWLDTSWSHFSKKKLKKVRNPGCPVLKMEESKMAAAVCQNWHFQPFWHFLSIFPWEKHVILCFCCQGIHFLKDLLNFDFSFWRRGQFYSKFKRGRFSMISRILKPICC